MTLLMTLRRSRVLAGIAAPASAAALLALASLMWAPSAVSAASTATATATTATTATTAATAATAATARDATTLRFESGFTGPAPANWPVDAPPVRFYILPGSSAPSCGLLLPDRKRVVPLVETDDGQDFPQCIGIAATLVFNHGAERYLLLRVRQRDTREDTSLTDLLFLDRGGIPQALDDLNDAAAPSGKPLGQVAGWLRARWQRQGAPSAAGKTSGR